MLEPTPAFQQIQQAFAAYVRDPEQAPPPGFQPERIALYRELFFNNVLSFIGGAFPVLREVLPEAQWLALLRDFFARHRCATPYFAGIPEEFLDYLQRERAEAFDDPPFLLELAHYEWVELALAVAMGEPPRDNPELLADPLECRVFLSETAWPLAYRFPVHRIGRDFQPTEAPPQPTCLAVYRDGADQVRFMELNPVSYRLLQILEEAGERPARECLRQIAEELGYADAEAIMSHGAETLRALAERGVIGAV